MNLTNKKALIVDTIRETAVQEIIKQAVRDFVTDDSGTTAMPYHIHDGEKCYMRKQRVSLPIGVGWTFRYICPWCTHYVFLDYI